MGSLQIYDSFDAQVWANEFVRIAQRDHSIATDVEAMRGWFANALMRGYDQHFWESKEYKQMIRRATVPWWKRWLVPLSKFGR